MTEDPVAVELAGCGQPFHEGGKEMASVSSTGGGFGINQVVASSFPSVLCGQQETVCMEGEDLHCAASEGGLEHGCQTAQVNSDLHFQTLNRLKASVKSVSPSVSSIANDVIIGDGGNSMTTGGNDPGGVGGAGDQCAS